MPQIDMANRRPQNGTKSNKIFAFPKYERMLIFVSKKEVQTYETTNMC